MSSLDHVRWLSKPSLKQPVIVTAFTGWNDAGGIAIQHEDEYKVPNAAERTIKRLEQIFFNKDNNNEQ